MFPEEQCNFEKTVELNNNIQILAKAQKAQESTGNLYNITWNIIISGRKGITTDDLYEDADKKILKLKFASKAASLTSTELISVVIPSGNPNESVQGFSVEPVFRGLQVSWTKDETLQINHKEHDGQDAEAQTPSEVIVILTPYDGGEKSLDAYKPGETGDTKKACTFKGDGSEDAQCIVGCVDLEDADKPYYLDSEQGAEGVMVKTANYSDGAVSIRGLDLDKTYMVTVQYTKGLKRECKYQKPEENITLTELNGAIESKPGDERCFIVSAAYGSPFYKRVDLFRWARDHFILPFPLGQELMDAYYENSQPLAEWIRQSPLRQKVVRGILWLPALALVGLKAITESSLFVKASVFLILFLSLFWFLKRRRLSKQFS